MPDITDAEGLEIGNLTRIKYKSLLFNLQIKLIKIKWLVVWIEKGGNYRRLTFCRHQGYKSKITFRQVLL